MSATPITTLARAAQPEPEARDGDVCETVDSLFRRESGQLVSVLTRLFGPSRIDLAQDVVQEAFSRAMHNWPFTGVPANPSGWLMRVARNRAVDIIRSDSARERVAKQLGCDIESRHRHRESLLDCISDREILDDQLRMIFLCCHPRLTIESQIALTLKTLCGFSVEEISLGLRIRSTAVAKRLSRAKRQIRCLEAPLELPEANHLDKRLEAVLQVLYLLFNEGYCPHTGESVVRESLCDDAIYLTDLLAAHKCGNRPQTHALLALMLFQSSRLDARSDPTGSLLLLDQQDRSRWDRTQIAAGFRHLHQAQSGQNITRFHVEAGIAACHAASVLYEDTDWNTICSLYDMLVEMSGSPIAGLNRAVAISMRDGAQAGIRELGAVRSSQLVSDYYLLHTVSAHMRSRVGDVAGAKADYLRALACQSNIRERSFIVRRVAALSE